MQKTLKLEEILKQTFLFVIKEQYSLHRIEITEMMVE